MILKFGIFNPATFYLSHWFFWGGGTFVSPCPNWLRLKTKIRNQQIIFIQIPAVDLYYVVKLFRCADNRESYGYFGKAKSYSYIRFRNFYLPSGNRHLKILLQLHLEHDRPWFFRYRFGPIYFTGRTDASTKTVVSRSLDNSGMFI